MAERCANCGRADLLQAQLSTYQCLACGFQTDASGNVVVPVEKSPLTSNAGLPVVELSNGVVVGDASEYGRPDHEPEVVIGWPEKAPEAPKKPRPARVDESYVPAEAVVKTVTEIDSWDGEV